MQARRRKKNLKQKPEHSSLCLCVHVCAAPQPNCYSTIRVMGSQKMICLWAKRYIEAGEELAYDYNLADADNKEKCTCGAEK